MQCWCDDCLWKHPLPHPIHPTYSGWYGTLSPCCLWAIKHFFPLREARKWRRVWNTAVSSRTFMSLSMYYLLLSFTRLCTSEKTDICPHNLTTASKQACNCPSWQHFPRPLQDPKADTYDPLPSAIMLHRQANYPGMATLLCQPSDVVLEKKIGVRARPNGRTLNWNMCPMNANCLCSRAMR